MGTRRGRELVTLAACAVGALVLGIAGLSLVVPTGTDDPPSARLAISRTTEAVRLDLGPLPAGAVAGCLTDRFASSTSEVEVRYGVQQRTRSGAAAVLVLRNRAGELLLCDEYGADSPAVHPVPEPSAADPVVFLGNGRRTWDCGPAGRTLHRFAGTEWLAVAPEVRRVKARVVVDGVPGPWFVARARNGYVHLVAWLDGPVDRRTNLALDHRVVGADGTQVPQHALPLRQRLAGCAGGSATIG